MQGTLDFLRPPAILSVLATQQRSGVLLLDCPLSEESGRIFLRHGRVVRASLEGRANLPAVFYLLGWTQGTFQFFAQDNEIADEIGMPTPQILLEHSRRVDEISRVDPEGE
jgi:hypothetical protein